MGASLLRYPSEFDADTLVRLAGERSLDRRMTDRRGESADGPRCVRPQEPIRVTEVTDHDRFKRRRSVVARSYERIATQDSRPARREVEMAITIEKLTIGRAQDLGDIRPARHGG
jgi:hypothetical protein